MQVCDSVWRQRSGRILCLDAGRWRGRRGLRRRMERRPARRRTRESAWACETRRSRGSSAVYRCPIDLRRSRWIAVTRPAADPQASADVSAEVWSETDRGYLLLAVDDDDVRRFTVATDHGQGSRGSADAAAEGPLSEVRQAAEAALEAQAAGTTDAEAPVRLTAAAKAALDAGHGLAAVAAAEAAGQEAARSRLSRGATRRGPLGQEEARGDSRARRSGDARRSARSRGARDRRARRCRPWHCGGDRATSGEHHASSR